MSRSLFGLSLGQVPGISPRRTRIERRKSRLSQCFGAEPLEIRALLATVTVHIFNFDFSANPQGQPIVDPTIHVGDTIHWVDDQGFHSTTSVAGSAESWDSGAQNTGFTFDHTFTHAGTFTYFCSIHGQDNGNGTAGGMSGTITVLPATAALTSIAVTPANPSIVS